MRITARFMKGAAAVVLALSATMPAHAASGVERMFVQGGAGAVPRAANTKLKERVTPEDFGAVGDGVADDSGAIAKAFAASHSVSFGSRTYRMVTSVTKVADNVTVDFGSAILINDGPDFMFNFCTRANTPQCSGLTIRGGQFEQANPATTSNRNFIRIAATKNFAVRGVSMKNVSNGGLYIEAGSEDGVVDGVAVRGMSGYATNRAIWLAGDTATDFASQLVDISSITRNATALPVYAVKNVKIINSTIVMSGYGIYLMNARDVKIENNYIDISGGGARAISLNNYSPGAVVRGNTIKSNGSATGIIATQFSSNVLISGNNFSGTFGGGRDIYVAYLADVLITKNRFNTDSTQQILIDMGGTAVVKSNFFTRSSYSANTRVVRIDTIDATVAGTGTYGNTAKTLPGLVFEHNITKVRNVPVFVNAGVAKNGNIPGLDIISVRDNTFFNFDTAAGSDEYGLRINGKGTTYLVKYVYSGNTMYPAANANRNTANVTGTGGAPLKTDVQFATFRITNPAVAGTITTAKLSGANFTCTVSRSGFDLVLAPRTLGGAAGAQVATPISVTDAGGTGYRYNLIQSGSNYLLRAFDAAGAQVQLNSAAATIDVTVSHK